MAICNKYYVKMALGVNLEYHLKLLLLLIFESPCGIFENSFIEFSLTLRYCEKKKHSAKLSNICTHSKAG